MPGPVPYVRWVTKGRRQGEREVRAEVGEEPVHGSQTARGEERSAAICVLLMSST